MSSRIISRERFSIRAFDGSEMQEIGETVLESVISRIRRGVNANDGPAKPLKPGRGGRFGYPDLKKRKGLQPIRDIVFSGRTLQAAKVSRTADNEGELGFNDARADRIMHANNLIDPMFALSPTDKVVLSESVQKIAVERHITGTVKG